MSALYGAAVRLVLASAALGEGLAMLSAGFLLQPLSRSLILGWPAWVRLGALIAGWAASLCVYETSGWYIAAHQDQRESRARG